MATICLGVSACGSADAAPIYTLYREAATPARERVHIATFDAAQSCDYNRDNCFTDATYSRAKASRVAGAMMVGLGDYLLTRPDMFGWQQFGGAALVALGVHQAGK